MKIFNPNNYLFLFYFKECHPSCGIIGSTQTRYRTCLSNQCIGKNIEKRDCLYCSTQLKSNWSCWTDWSECSLCTSTRLYSTQYRNRICLTNSCEGLSYEERSCLCHPLLNEYHFTLIHLILISLISFSFGCLIIFCIYALCHYRYRGKYIQKDEHDYFQGSTSNSSSSPHTAIDSETFLTLDQNKFRNFDSSSSNIPSRKLNMYINPRDMHSLPPPPLATLKRTSLMSSMKTNLDADDL